ncbi:MAG: hypothetical protein ACRDK1_10050 [Solirubrobacterales bacterium]
MLVVLDAMRCVSVSLVVMLAAVLAGCGGGGSTSSGRAHGPGTLYLEGLAKGNLDRLVALNVQTGRARTLPIMVGCSDADVCFVPSGGKLVIASGRTSVYDPHRPGPPHVRHIGSAWSIVPSATDGRVWLALRDHRKKVRGTWPTLKLRTVREVTVDGRVTRTARAPGLDWWPGGPGSFPVSAARAGLVFVTDDGLRVWDVRRREVTVRVPGRAPSVFDTRENQIAWCGGSCQRLRITDGRTGKTKQVKPPAGYSFKYEGAFSPDGSLLAVPVVPDAEAKDPDGARWSMALVNLRRGAASIVAGSRLDPDYHAMAWSASDGRLFFSAGGGRIMTYRPGAPRATKIGRVHGPIFHMAAL